MELYNKKISVIGAKKSGIAAAKLVKKLGGIPFVSDNSSEKNLTESIAILNEAGIRYEVGQHSEKVFDAELFVVSPGVPSDVPVIISAAEKGIKIISEIELAYNFCKGKIIAITGTNGKTTTTALMGHIFKTAGYKTYIAGNIGITAFSEIALDVQPDEFVSLEVSSFQLDFIDKFKPAVGVILNITPDHLNRYKNEMRNYIFSKYRVTKNQTSKDVLIINADDRIFTEYPINTQSKVRFFSLSGTVANGISIQNNQFILKEKNQVKFKCDVSELLIKGDHNKANAMAAIAAAVSFGLEENSIKKALNTFPGVEHRIEFVRELNGVKFINDSKATNVDSVWYALKSFEEPLFLILGGLDKGGDYNKIKDLVVQKVKKIYAIGDSADKVYNSFKDSVTVEKIDSLEECVTRGYSEAAPGDVVLLSPACASYDMFDNFEHRGKVFKETVQGLK